MELIPHWRRVLKRAWSIRFMAAAFVFSSLELVLPAFDGALPIPPRLIERDAHQCLRSGHEDAAALHFVAIPKLVGRKRTLRRMNGHGYPPETGLRQNTPNRLQELSTLARNADNVG